VCAYVRGDMAERGLRLFFIALMPAIVASACSLESSRTDDGSFATEGGDACTECQTILVECTSTSTDEGQFVACRDQWQQCQKTKSLAREQCTNPDDKDACSLCRSRMVACKEKEGADAAVCEDEFGICKAYLITRGDIQQQCTKTEEVPPEVACGICQKDLAVCVSDEALENALAVCTTKFEQCQATHQLEAGVCTAPGGEKACQLCTEQHSDCAASGDTTCDTGFGACTTAIVKETTCTLGGEGGSGGGGSGGEGGGGTGCAHDPCGEGAALTTGCDAGGCVAAVCNTDSFCCTTSWDSYCVSTAQSTAACGCTI
jgi:hypothetical protein